MNKLVHCADGYNSYASWIIPMGFKITNNADEADLLLLAGGQDIDSAIYNQPRGYNTGGRTRRDEVELELYKKFDRPGKYMLGICRGAQLICAKQKGGALVQHMAHPGYHSITTNEGDEMTCISMHHQQMLLKDINPKDYELLAWAKGLSPIHLNGEDEDYNFGDDYQEPEVVVFNGNKVAIQSHPEVMSVNSKFVGYCRSLVDKYILGETGIKSVEGIGRETSKHERFQTLFERSR